MNSDDFFEKFLEMLFGLEGGYSNRKADLGGPTNYGITQDTFDSWRKKNNRPLGNVKTDIYENSFVKIVKFSMERKIYV